VKNILRLPTGRGMAAEINGTWIINIYAPSGAEKRTEIGHFFTHEVTALMPPVRRETILAGDFNAIIDKNDSRSQKNISRALKTFISGCALSDAWEITQNRHGYTYYANNTASRLDRIYVTQRLYSRKTGVERVAAAFTDYKAVVLRLTIDVPLPVRGRSYWKMNSSLLRSETFDTEIDVQWAKWQKHKRFDKNSVTWWGQYVKKMIRKTFIAEGTNRRRDHKQLEDFYYHAIYGALKDDKPNETKILTLKRLKAKIVNLHSKNKKRLLIDSGEQYMTTEEEPTIYRLIKRWKRQTSRMIDWTYDTDEVIQTSATGIMRTFVKYISNKFETLPVNENQIRGLLHRMKARIKQEANTDLEAPITMEEIEEAVLQGKNAKAPGNDGISHDFLKNKWKMIRHDLLQILNDMYVEEEILNSQNMA